MREDLKNAMKSNEQCMKQLTEMQSKTAMNGGLSVSPSSLVHDKDQESHNSTANKQQTAQTALIDVKAEPEEAPDEDLNPDQEQQIQETINSFVEKFTQD